MLSSLNPLIVIMCPLVNVFASVTNMSGEKLFVRPMSTVSLACLIEPFNRNRTHSWHIERANGSKINITGSRELPVEKMIYEPGKAVLPGLLDLLFLPSIFVSPNISQPINGDHTTLAESTLLHTQKLSALATVPFNATENVNYSMTNTSAVNQSNHYSDLTGAIKSLSTIQTAEANWSASDMTGSTSRYLAFHQYNYLILTIMDVVEEDEGLYYCEYDCRECDSRRTELVYTVPATLDTISLVSDPDVEFVEFDQKVSLTCNVRSRPPARIRWVLILNGLNTPLAEDGHAGNPQWHERAKLYSVQSRFSFRGGTTGLNPMVVYCEVISPVSLEQVLSEPEAEPPHAGHWGGPCSENASTTTSVKGALCNEEVLSPTQSTHTDTVPIHWKYLRTRVFKRKIFELPNTALSKPWRTAVITASTAILLLPVIAGLLQICMVKPKFMDSHNLDVKQLYCVSEPVDSSAYEREASASKPAHQPAYQPA